MQDDASGYFLPTTITENWVHESGVLYSLPDPNSYSSFSAQLTWPLLEAFPDLPGQRAGSLSAPTSLCSCRGSCPPPAPMTVGSSVFVMSLGTPRGADWAWFVLMLPGLAQCLGHGEGSGIICLMNVHIFKENTLILVFNRERVSEMGISLLTRKKQIKI